MTTAKRARANAALLPTARHLVDLYRRGVRGPSWRTAMAKLSTTVDLLDTKGTPDA